MKEQIIDKMSNLITSAFGLVAALAWNDAVKSILQSCYNAEKIGVAGSVIYAVIITAIAVIATIWIGWTFGKIKDLAASLEGEEEKKPKKVESTHE